MTDHNTLIFRSQHKTEKTEATVPPLSTRQGESGFQAPSLSRGGRQFQSNYRANSAAVGGMPDIVANKPLLRLTARGWVRVATWSLLNNPPQKTSQALNRTRPQKQPHARQPLPHTSQDNKSSKIVKSFTSLKTAPSLGCFCFGSTESLVEKVPSNR